MFKFKSDFSKFKVDVDLYIENLNFEDALRNMNILLPDDIFNNEMSMELGSNEKNINISFHISVNNIEITETNELNIHTIKNNDLLRAV